MEEELAPKMKRTGKGGRLCVSQLHRYLFVTFQQKSPSVVLTRVCHLVAGLELPPLTDALAGPIVTAKLVAVVPRWYFGVSLDSGGGNVRLAEIKHASKAEVWSRGGRISSASTIQAVHVALNAQGGSILARRVVGQTVDISVKNETKLNTHAPEFRNRDTIVAPAVDIQSLAGVSVVVDAGSGKARVGSCHVDASGRISCGEFEAATFRGPVRDCSDSTHVDISHPDIEDCVLDLAPDGNAVIGGLDGCLHVRGEGGSSVDVQVNDGSHRLVVEMEQGNDANLVVGVSPTMRADVILKGRVDRCWLPQDAVKMLPSTEPSSKRGKTDTTSVNFGDELCVRLQPNEELHSLQDRKIPISRLQRGKDMVGVIDNKARSSMDDAQTRAGDEEVETLGNQSILFEMNNLPCQIVAKGCGNVEIRRRSWMEARMAGLLLSRRHAR